MKLNNILVTKVIIELIKHTHDVSHLSNAQRIAEIESSTRSFSLTCIPQMHEWILAISCIHQARPRQVGGASASTLKTDSPPITVTDKDFCAIAIDY